MEELQRGIRFQLANDFDNLEQGSPFIQKWDKTGRTWEDVVNIGYTRYGYSNIGSAVPLSSGIEKFCLTEDQRKKYFSSAEDQAEEDMLAGMMIDVI